jgi:peptidoglycan/LPS O-acetylase OafA/YrhL
MASIPMSDPRSQPARVSATAGRADGSRLEGLDALRGLAALLVFLHHGRADELGLGPLGRSGQLGVVVFFVLSGYLIWRPFVDGEVDLRRYAIRRLARIYPAYLAALVALSLVHGSRQLLDFPAHFLLLAQNNDPRTFQTLLYPAWTLQLEVTFYVLAPIVATVARGRVAWLVALGLASLLTAAAIRLTSTLDPGELARTLSGFPLKAWLFVPGMLLAVAAARRPDVVAFLGSRRGSAVAAAAFLLALAVTPVERLPHSQNGNVLLEGLGVLIAVPLVAACLNGRGRLPVLVGFGAALSYPFYLWHADVLDLLHSTGLHGWAWLAVGLALTTVIAVASYRLVEQPALQLARRWEDRVVDGWRSVDLLRRRSVRAAARRLGDSSA